LYAERTRIAEQIDREELRLARRRRETAMGSNAVIDAAADLYCVSVQAVLSQNRSPRVVKARQAACWILRAQEWSLPRIGEALGRDHTTVLYACRKVDASPSTKALLWPIVHRFDRLVEEAS
jgi:chromosomal replication initiator protein